MRSLTATILLLVLLTSSCASPRFRESALVLDDGERSAVAEAGLSVEALAEFLGGLNDGAIDSAAIYSQGRLVLYRTALPEGTRRDLRSATKSITSLLVGIAIDRGFIDSVDDPVSKYIPEFEPRWAEGRVPGAGDSSTADEPIRIRHMLSMSSGLAADDWNPASPGNEERMYRTRDWIRFFLDLEREVSPGWRFSYATAGVVALGEVLRRATGMGADEFAETRLFGPMGITNYHWEYTPVGQVDTGGHLHMDPRDFAKIGLLVTSGGVWNGRQIVSSRWIEESLLPRRPVFGAGASGPWMGYLWWLEPLRDGRGESFQARGNGGQFLIAVPDREFLFVFTGRAYNDRRLQELPFALARRLLNP